MFNNANVPSLSDIAAVTNGNNDGFGGNNGWWILIILFAIFCGWGNGGYGSGGIQENYVLTSDFSQLSRQLADTTAMTERKLDGVNNGICSLGYDQLNQMNGINSNVMTVGNAIQSQLAQCCCDNKSAIADLKYTVGTTGAMLDRSIADGLCQTNFNMQTNTRDIIDNGRSDTQAILAKLDAMENSRKDEKIATQQAIISDLKFAASQANQNNYLIDKLGYKMPVAAYTVPNPFCSCGYGQNVGYYGTTIA